MFELARLRSNIVADMAGTGLAVPSYNDLLVRLVALALLEHPALNASLENVLSLGDAALTGPVSRGDVATVATHVDTLRRAAPQVLPAYLAMARRTAERARDAGRLSDAQAAAVLEVLA